MANRKTANDVAKDLSIVSSELNAHERECNIRWKQIFLKTDDLQASVQSMKTWLLAGLTTIIVSLMAIIVRGIV
tara:strand:+ start:299 stop:520 length:222 start_codon:yes stop_codon:yes gene_type:complete